MAVSAGLFLDRPSQLHAFSSQPSRSYWDVNPSALVLSRHPHYDEMLKSDEKLIFDALVRLLKNVLCYGPDSVMIRLYLKAGLGIGTRATPVIG